MAFVTKATFKVDNRGGEIPAGTEVTAKDLGCEKADLERFVELGLIEVVKKPARNGDNG